MDGAGGWVDWGASSKDGWTSERWVYANILDTIVSRRTCQIVGTWVLNCSGCTVHRGCVGAKSYWFGQWLPMTQFTFLGWTAEPPRKWEMAWEGEIRWWTPNYDFNVWQYSNCDLFSRDCSLFTHQCQWLVWNQVGGWTRSWRNQRNQRVAMATSEEAVAFCRRFLCAHSSYTLRHTIVFGMVHGHIILLVTPLLPVVSISLSTLTTLLEGSERTSL